MPAIKLKPCPFCGGEAVLHVENGAYIICKDCLVRTPVKKDFGGSLGDSANKLMELWNERVENE